MKRQTYERLNLFFEIANPVLAIIGFAILFAALFQAAGVIDFGGLFSW